MQNLRAELNKQANLAGLRPTRDKTPHERVEHARHLHFDLGQEEIFAVVFSDVFSAASHGDLTGVRVAVTASRVAHIDDLQKHGETLLHFAVKGRRANIIKYCLELGADVNRKNKIGWNAVHMAAAGDYDDILELLFENGAEMDARDLVGNTAAHLAAGSGCAKALEAIHRCQTVDPPSLQPLTQANMSGCYPLHQAAQNGHEDCVRFLASIGVDLGTLDCTKETAAHKAGRSGNLSVLEVLRMAGADMDALNAEIGVDQLTEPPCIVMAPVLQQGDSPMHLAHDDSRYG